MSKIDIEQLRIEIRSMKRWNTLYRVLKEELTARGYWRNRERGNPKAGFKKGWGKSKRGGQV